MDRHEAARRSTETSLLLWCILVPFRGHGLAPEQIGFRCATMASRPSLRRSRRGRSRRSRVSLRRSREPGSEHPGLDRGERGGVRPSPAAWGGGRTGGSFRSIDPFSRNGATARRSDSEAGRRHGSPRSGAKIHGNKPPLVVHSRAFSWPWIGAGADRDPHGFRCATMASRPSLRRSRRGRSRRSRVSLRRRR